MVEKRKPRNGGLGRGLGSLIPALPSAEAEAATPASDDASSASYRTGRQGIDTFFPKGEDSGRRRSSDLAATLAGDMRASHASRPSKSGAKSNTKPATKTPAKSGAAKSSAKPAADAAAVPTAVSPDVSRETTAADAPAVIVGEPNYVPVTAAPELADQGTETHTEALIEASSDKEIDEITAVDGAVSSAEEALELLPVPGAHFADLDVHNIRPNPRQPREVFDEEALEELVFSVREIGVLQPVVVREIPGGPVDGVEYELIMGERRWRASKLAGNETVPAIIRTTTDDVMLRDALLENLHRSQLNPLEEAAAYSQLLEDFGCTQEELATRIGRSRPQISNMMRLMKLPPLVQRRVAAGVLSMGHARALLGLKDSAAIERLAQKVVAEGLSVRTTEELVAMGGLENKPEAARRIGRVVNPVMDDIAGRLSDRFDTRVKIALGARKGKLTVEFSGVEDLHRILGVIAPGEDIDA